MKKILLLLFISVFVTVVTAQNYIEVRKSDLPKKITEYLSKNLVNYDIVRSAKTIEKGVITFYVVADSRGRKGVYSFDKDGKFLSREANLKGKVKPATETAPPPSGKKADDKTTPVKK